MILVDRELERRHDQGRPVRVGIIGAGYMGRGIAQHILSPVTGMELSAVYNRTGSKAMRAYTEAGVAEPVRVESVGALDQAIADGRPAVTEDPFVLCEADQIDVVVEATGEVEFGARVVSRAIEAGKHVVLMNAELDATLGPILKVHADRAGVVITNTDGDEPGVAMNLVRMIRMVGFKPVAAGNIKGMLDHYRTPETQREFAERHGQKPRHITSFADGTKLSMETTVLANATGFGVARRGMVGPACEKVEEVVGLLPEEAMLSGGIVDYCLGAAPHTGAWVIGTCEHPVQQRYLDYFKLGKGPFYLFHTPFHLPHVQIISTIARAALFSDATVAPLGGPSTEVLTLAKRDLAAGETLDGIGGFATYGWIDSSAVQRRDGLVPMGLSEGCVLTNDVAKDQPVRYADVVLPADRLCDELRREQDQHFTE